MTFHDLDLLYAELSKRTTSPQVWDAYSRRFVSVAFDADQTPKEVTFHKDIALRVVDTKFVRRGTRWLRAEVEPTTATEPDEG